MIVSKKVKVIWSTSNRKKYEEAGYTFTGYGTPIVVDVDDLPFGSTAKITVSCWKCKQESVLEYRKYVKSKTGLCRECTKFNKKEEMIPDEVVEKVLAKFGLKRI